MSGVVVWVEASVRTDRLSDHRGRIPMDEGVNKFLNSQYHRFHPPPSLNPPLRFQISQAATVSRRNGVAQLQSRWRFRGSLKGLQSLLTGRPVRVGTPEKHTVSFRPVLESRMNEDTRSAGCRVHHRDHPSCGPGRGRLSLRLDHV